MMARADEAWERSAIVTDLERLGGSAQLIDYVMNIVLEKGMSWRAIVQRSRRAREKRLRIAVQKTERPALKRRCIEAYQRTCAYCGRIGTSDADPDGETWELDRILPGAAGGEYFAKNVALACKRCNRAKGENITFCPPQSLADREAA